MPLKETLYGSQIFSFGQWIHIYSHYLFIYFFIFVNTDKHFRLQQKTAWKTFKHTSDLQGYLRTGLALQPFFPGVRDELPNIISFMHAWNIEIKAKVINNRLIIISVHRLELCDDISFILQT